MYNPLKILMLVLTLAAFGTGFVTWLRRRSRPERRAPVRTIANADETTLNKIRGLVDAPEPLVAPLTGRECVYYRIEFLDTSHGEAASFAQARDFTVRDSTGAAHIVADRACFEIVADIVEMGRASALSDRARTVFGRLGVAIPEIASVEVREAIVGPGSTIDIIGHVVREPASEPTSAERGFRDSVATTVVFSGNVQVVEKKRERRYIGARP